MASAWNICLKSTRFMPCSPVATPIGADRRRIAAWPRMSSGLVGSSIQHGSKWASALIHSMASATSQTWLASIIRFASRPITSRAISQPADVVLEVRADLQLDVRVAVVDGLAAQPRSLSSE